MFEKWRTDRRTGYSFRGHFKRIVENRGFGRVALTLGAAALVAGTAFANCSGSSITGPAADPAPPPAPQMQTFTTKTGQFRLPLAALPPASPCTADPIVWDQGSTMIQSTMQTSTGLDGRFHVQFHLNAQGQGASATRRYSGSQEYNSQEFTVLSGDKNKFKFEWNVKVIARGEDGTLFPEDDFHLHVVATMGPAPNFFPEAADATAPPGECR